MNKILLIIVMCLVASVAVAQAPEMVRVSYEYRWLFNGQERVNDYNLQISKEKSIFYNPMTLWMDSISRSDAACQAYGEMASAMMQNGNGASVPNRSASMYVLKSFPDGNIRMYEDFADQFAFYDESFDEMQWEIGDSIQNIIGYECTAASTRYHGRTWTAWFAPEIPLQDGPWKFHGLPGMILSVVDDDGKHRFDAIGIEHTNRPMPEIYRTDYYSRESRKEFLKARRNYVNDPIGYLLRDLPAGCKVMTLDGTEISRDSKVLVDEGYDFLETDYR